MDELLAMGFQVNPTMMVIIALQSGHIMAINRAFAEKMHFSCEEANGKPFSDLAIWDDPVEIRNMMAHLQRDRKMLDHEIACHAPDGGQWCARISAAVTHFKHQDCAIATIDDITGQRRIEEELHRNEEFYRLLADCAGDVIWVLDLDGKFLYMSHAIEYRMGYRPDQVVGQSFEPLLTTASAVQARELLNQVSAQLKTGQHVGCQRVELELVSKQGSSFWSEVNFCGMYNSAGEFIGLQGVSRDVTDRKRAEESARESLRMLTDLAQNLPGAAFQLFVRQDGSRGFHYLSPRAQEMFDLSPEWRIGLNVHPEDSARFMESFNEAVKTRSPWSFEGRFILKSGETRWFQGLARPSPRGKELIFDGMLLDITERKQAEEALRTAARRKDEFLAMLAHELRNPLAPIRYAVDVMKLASQDAAVSTRQLAMIERQIRHMSRLIDDLLDAARVTRGEIGLRKAAIALNEVIEQAIEVSSILLGPRKDDFSCTMPEQKILVEGDFTRLVQAIGNVLNNAVKYSDHGQKINLTISMESASAPEWRFEAVICVQDQGVGIDPEILPHIFEIFIQADKSLDRTRGGLGIGLTLSRRIVEQHGGSMQACSAGLGQGSTFCLRLPTLMDRNLHG